MGANLFFSASKLNGFWEYGGGGGGGVGEGKKSHIKAYFIALFPLLRIMKINNSIFSKILFALRNEIIHHGAFMWLYYFLDFLFFYQKAQRLYRVESSFFGT